MLHSFTFLLYVILVFVLFTVFYNFSQFYPCFLPNKFTNLAYICARFSSAQKALMMLTDPHHSEVCSQFPHPLTHTWLQLLHLK